MYRVMPAVDRLPYALYRAEQVRELDRAAIEKFSIPGATLMQRAGRAAFDLLRRTWPDARDLTVVCGVGNNGGDGYVVARLALEAGLRVRVLQLGDPERLGGDALSMALAYSEAGGRTEVGGQLSRATEVIVDGVFGTGLQRDVTGAWARALQEINEHAAPVLALDVPSGLHSDTGQVLGSAIKAALSVSFIGLKQGMFTGEAAEHCGRIHFDALQVPAQLYRGQIAAARRIDWARLSGLLTPRRRSAHKGHFGHVLVVGGAPGFAGAARMAAEAAARTGAGLVSLATHPEHASCLCASCPELMCHGVADAEALGSLLRRATVVAIGPGLGRGDWGRRLLEQVLASDLPLVVDADALNLLIEDARSRAHWVLTPHPGEAARLLGWTPGDIQANRFAAVRALQERFGGVSVLKGSGTLVQGGAGRPVAVCSEGNPGMASGGMGDVLTGLIAGLIAQGLELEDAAALGVSLHGAAADRAARTGERGLLATDLFAELRPLLNPGQIRDAI